MDGRSATVTDDELLDSRWPGTILVGSDVIVAGWWQESQPK